MKNKQHSLSLFTSDTFKIRFSLKKMLLWLFNSGSNIARTAVFATPEHYLPNAACEAQCSNEYRDTPGYRKTSSRFQEVNKY